MCSAPAATAAAATWAIATTAASPPPTSTSRREEDRWTSTTTGERYRAAGDGRLLPRSELVLIRSDEADRSSARAGDRWRGTGPFVPSSHDLHHRTDRRLSRRPAARHDP